MEKALNAIRVINNIIDAGLYEEENVYNQENLYGEDYDYGHGDFYEEDIVPHEMLIDSIRDLEEEHDRKMVEVSLDHFHELEELNKEIELLNDINRNLAEQIAQNNNPANPHVIKHLQEENDFLKSKLKDFDFEENTKLKKEINRLEEEDTSLREKIAHLEETYSSFREKSIDANRAHANRLLERGKELDTQNLVNSLLVKEVRALEKELNKYADVIQKHKDDNELPF